MKNYLLLLQLAFLTAVPLASFAQGNLTPPGAPAPTMKSLDQVAPGTPITSIPYSITNSGLYFLTTNLTGSSGIQIETNNVTIDLRGFNLRGNNASEGILAESAYTNLIVRNGTITQWFDGIYAASSVNCLFEHLTFSQNGNAIIGGETSILSDCLAEQNTQGGFEFDTGARIINCVSRYNIGYGFNTSSGANVSGCTAAYNSEDGFFIDRGLIQDCVAEGNTNNGINVFINCLVINNKCLDNKIAGITSSEGGHRIDGNDVTGSAFDILLSSATGNLVIHNSATGNSTNYDIETGNTVGPIITSSTIGTNTNPACNFSY